ncbi:MAG: ATP-binding protein [Candidatus Eisenbacteria bacterium]|nr:ATP-binding protein [Candidatus Eisenbacteria bacterium]
MLARVRTALLWGLEAFAADCEVDMGPGLPGFVMVGLPDSSAREARERVWPALRNTGLAPPERRVTVNLAPAGRRKEGASADLALALGMLVATGQAPSERLERAAALGELALDGRLRGTRGTLSLAEAAWRAGARTLVCAAEAAPEAALVEGLEVLAAATLLEAFEWLRGESLPRAAPASPDARADGRADLADVRGQAMARRALEIAAAGGHHLLLIGPPGAGKSMLAVRLPGLLPPLEPEEALVVTRLHSAAGLRLPGNGMMCERPFRAPHHSTTRAGLIGGGSPPRPGELSLAHQGVLFLDEFAEYPRTLLDALREPLETGAVHLTRASGHAHFPARPLLVAAMNPWASVAIYSTHIVRLQTTRVPKGLSAQAGNARAANPPAPDGSRADATHPRPAARRLGGDRRRLGARRVPPARATLAVDRSRPRARPRARTGRPARASSGGPAPARAYAGRVGTAGRGRHSDREERRAAEPPA